MDNARPSLTVGITAQNASRYLASAIEGLCRQTVDDFEIMALDDASDDAGPEMLSAWASGDPRVNIRRSDRRLGTVEALSSVVSKARTEFFMWAPQRATWSADFIARLRAEHLADEPVDLTVPCAVEVDERGAELACAPWSPDAPPASTYYRQYLLRAAAFGWCGGIFRRTALASALDTARHYPHAWAVEYLLLLPVLLAGKVRGANEARIIRIADTSSPPAAAGLYRDFMGYASEELSEASLTTAERAYLAPFVAKYAARHAQPLRRFVRRRLEAG